MAIKALVDNNERYAVARGRHTFYGGTKDQPFHGTEADFAQVKACMYLETHDIEDDGIVSSERMLPDRGPTENESPHVQGGQGGYAHRVTTEQPAAAQDDEPSSTEDAKNLAENENVDLKNITGSGKDGRIVIGDVRKHIVKGSDS